MDLDSDLQNLIDYAFDLGLTRESYERIAVSGMIHAVTNIQRRCTLIGPKI